MKLVEANIAHHKGKFAAGNSLTIADFVMAGAAQATFLNDKSPMPFHGIAMKVKAECPVYCKYEETLKKELPLLTNRGAEYPF